MTNVARRQLSAIMFADIVGYTAMMQENESGAMARRRRYRSVLDDAVREFGG